MSARSRIPRAGVWLCFAVGLAAVAAVRAGEPFRPAPLSGGPLRIWGTEAMSTVVAYWTEGFRRFHPEVAIEPRLMGSDTAIPGLYSGLADIALLGRANDVTDDNGFSRPKGYAFERFELMRGSLEAEGKSAALAVLVHRANPVSNLSVAQLAALAGCGCCRNVRPIRRWGELGAGGAWAHRPVHLYLYDVHSGTGQYFLRVVLNGSRKLDWDRVRDFSDLRRADGSIEPASQRILDAFLRDPGGIAVTNLRYADQRSRVVAIAERAGFPYLLPARETIIAGSYPLARSTYAFIDRPPGKPIDPVVSEFLRYTLSREGQADVGREQDYLPLDDDTLATQLRRLD